MNKNTKGARTHARRRAHERYGVIDFDHVRKQIINSIQSNSAIPVQQLTNTRMLYSANVDGKTYNVIFSHRTNEIITFLPEQLREMQP